MIILKIVRMEVQIGELREWRKQLSYKHDAS